MQIGILNRDLATAHDKHTPLLANNGTAEFQRHRHGTARQSSVPLIDEVIPDASGNAHTAADKIDIPTAVIAAAVILTRRMQIPFFIQLKLNKFISPEFKRERNIT